jgi:hypothetical protein
MARDMQMDSTPDPASADGSAELRLPEVGTWYRGLDGRTFEIVAVDEKDETIEIQHFDGTVEELDTDAWAELDAEPVDQPEDWSGSMDVDEEDLPDDDQTHEEWADPLDFVDEQE